MSKAKFAIFNLNIEYRDKVTAASIKKAIGCKAVYEITENFSKKQEDKNISTLDTFSIIQFRNQVRRVVGGHQLFMFSDDALSSILGMKYAGRLYSVCTITPLEVKSFDPCLDRMMDVINMRNQIDTAAFNATNFLDVIGPRQQGYGDWTGKLDNNQMDFFNKLPQRLNDLKSEINGNLLNIDKDIADILNNGWD